MSENCTHDCNSCSQNCSERKPDSLLEPQNQYSSIKKVIGIVSGKGGVGKSLVTSLMAVTAQRRGFKTAILDGDVTGPSIPKIFGIKEKAQGDDSGIFPVESKTGIKIISTNLLLGNDEDPLIWRGPVIAGVVKQFWTDVVWGEVDYMFVDMPPGTGDVPLTVFQSMPIDGIIIVTSPQELVSMIVAKAAGMAEKMNVPVLGIIENMSWLECPDCGKKIEIFGKSHAEETAKKYNLDVIGHIPVDQRISSLCDKGAVELFDGDWLEEAADKIII